MPHDCSSLESVSIIHDREERRQKGSLLKMFDAGNRVEQSHVCVRFSLVVYIFVIHSLTLVAGDTINRTYSETIFVDKARSTTYHYAAMCDVGLYRRYCVNINPEAMH